MKHGQWDQRARKWSETLQQVVAGMLVGWIAATLPAEGTRPKQMVQDGKTEDAIKREMAAFITIHPQ